MPYHTSLIKLVALGILRKSSEGGGTEENERNFARVSPTEFFLYLISLVDVVSVPLTEANNQNLARGSPRSSLNFLRPAHSRIRVRFYSCCKKIKALPEGGQRLNSKNYTDQGRVIICRRVGCLDQLNSASKLLSISIRIKPRSQQSTTLKRKPDFQSVLFNLCQITPIQTT